MRVHYRSIQPCPFGQAFVRFTNPYDRDRLIHESPHPFGNVNVSFIPRDRAWNHKKVTMNYEVWLMFLDLNVDHWNSQLVDKALADWGKLVTWEEDPTHLARILVKARVVELEEIPWFIFTSEGDDFEGDTWIAQCEIIQSRVLGEQAPDEDNPPDVDVNPNLFDFFGYGQHGQGPAPPAEPDNAPNAEGWGLWPQPDNQAPQHGPHQPMNQQLQPQDQGPIAGEPFLELNDLLQPMEEQFDLNMALDDDLGGLDDLAPLDHDMAENPNLDLNNVEPPEDIIAVSSPSSMAASPPLFDLNKPTEVDVMVFIPMVNGEQLMINPHEIGEDELMNEVELLEAAQDQDIDILEAEPIPAAQIEVQPLRSSINNQSLQHTASGTAPMDDDQNGQHEQQGEHFQQLTHLGFVQLLEPHVDPVLSTASQSTHLPADLFRYWAKHFEPTSSSMTAEVPPAWVAFFTAALLNPSSFAWAKNFLSSPAWAYFSLTSGQGLTLSLPAKCPTETSPSCLQGGGVNMINSIEEQLEATGDIEGTLETQPQTPPPHSQELLKKPCDRVSPSTGPWSTKMLQQAGKLIIYEEDPSLWRSCRMLAQKKGFKGKSCADKRCFVCEFDPPTISPSIIKNLGTTFCHIDPEKLEAKTMIKKKKVSAPGEKKPNIKKKSKVDDDRSPKKKPKK